MLNQENVLMNILEITEIIIIVITETPHDSFNRDSIRNTIVKCKTNCSIVKKGENILYKDLSWIII